MKVLLVEDHELFRDGVSMILESLSNDIEIKWKSTATETLAFVKQCDGLDLILMDYNLPDGTGLDCLETIQALLPETPVIILSAEQDSNLIQSALTAGAKGFITKASSSKVMISAIQLVLSGGVYLPPEMLANAGTSSTPVTKPAANNTKMINKSNKNHQLTERQMDVLGEMVKGLSNKEIARQLNMSPSTVKVHVAAVLREFEVKNRTQAVSYAKLNSLV